MTLTEARVERASLTGESVPILVTLDSSEENAVEAKNLVFNSSLCMQGEFLGVVFATGDQSLIGRIASLASNTKVVETPLQKEISLFVRRLFIFATILGSTFFVISVSRGQYSVLLAIVNVFVVVLVACVPQGLPMTVIDITCVEFLMYVCVRVCLGGCVGGCTAF